MNRIQQLSYFTSWSHSVWEYGAMEILYKGKDQIAWKQLWRPEGRQLSDMQQFFFIMENSILLNVSSCLPFGLLTGFSSFFKASSAFLCIRCPWRSIQQPLQSVRIFKQKLFLVFELEVGGGGGIFKCNPLFGSWKVNLTLFQQPTKVVKKTAALLWIQL